VSEAPRRGASERLRIVVLGYLVRGPLGGLAWHHLQYVMGLAALGHDVYFLEDSDDYPGCYDPTRDALGTDPTYGLRFADRTFTRLGLADRWAYYDAHTAHWFGPAGEGMIARCERTDLVLNVSGMNQLRPWLQEVPARAFVDTDPVFTQIRHLTDPAARRLAEQHTSFFSFGENIASKHSGVPDDGFPWQPTRQPLVLDAWPVTPGRRDGRFTTVMQWDSYRAREYGGLRYGMKSDSFLPYLDLPMRLGRHFELAVGGPSAARARLRNSGWRVRNPLGPTRDPWTYQRYIRASKAEFSVAKHGYVVSQCGWFSERSAAYLASGRPVVVQETGFSDWLNVDSGALRFRTPEEAAAAIQSIDGSYARQCRAAREIAREFFDARDVLSRLVQSALGPAVAGVRSVGAARHLSS
jgi:hypothetical protein